jgi:hypothetical protein
MDVVCDVVAVVVVVVVCCSSFVWLSMASLEVLSYVSTVPGMLIYHEALCPR